MKKIKSLYKYIPSKSGRNFTGKITSRHKSGGSKKLYRIVNFVRKQNKIEGVIKKFIYDPKRNVYLMFVFYEDGRKEFLLKPKEVLIGNKVCFSEQFINVPGNCTYLKNIPIGTRIHNLEVKPNKNKTLIRSGNCFGTILGSLKGYIIVKLPSKKLGFFLPKCKATIGQLDFSEKKKKKAGYSRLKGIRPKVRGVAMNPCDHPHGGGEGKSPIGRKFPVTPWGKPALGVKTTSKKIKFTI